MDGLVGEARRVLKQLEADGLESPGELGVSVFVFSGSQYAMVPDGPDMVISQFEYKDTGPLEAGPFKGKSLMIPELGAEVARFRWRLDG